MKTFEGWFNSIPSTDNGEFLAYAESALRNAWNARQPEIDELKKALEEIANGHLQEKVSEQIAREALEEPNN